MVSLFILLPCSSKTLLPNDSPQTERLQPPEDSIVPKDMKSPPAIVNTRFQLHHAQPNTKKIYLKDFAQHLQNMLEDSGYKFSEEYEVHKCNPEIDFDHKTTFSEISLYNPTK